jgi:hypothetical protein
MAKSSYVFKFFLLYFFSYLIKCLALLESEIIPMTRFFFFSRACYTKKFLVIRISGIVIPKSLLLGIIAENRQLSVEIRILASKSLSNPCDKFSEPNKLKKSIKQVKNNFLTANLNNKIGAK